MTKILDKILWATKNSTFIFPLHNLPPFQYFRLAIVGALVENLASHSLRRLLINIE